MSSSVASLLRSAPGRPVRAASLYGARPALRCSANNGSGSIWEGVHTSSRAQELPVTASSAAFVEPLTSEQFDAETESALVEPRLPADVLPSLDESDEWASDGDDLLEEESDEQSFASLFGGQVDEEVKEIPEHLKVANCGLSAASIASLAARGIHGLFDVQKQVLTPAMEGRDIIARAKTGSGKTLAFALPTVEKIMNSLPDGLRSLQRGRRPLCLVLAPTRELARQVEREFITVAPGLVLGCYYGGTPIGAQLRQLRSGVDIVVGTPGRVIDLIDQNALDLGGIKFVILDEADQMLNVGFEKDVETILNNVPEERQTMLFSATVPKWVKKLVKQFLNDPLDIDLIGEGQSGKMADNIRALAVQVTDECRRSVLVDLLTVYGAGGKAIVFCQTKREADEVAAAVMSHLPCEPLHGDMSQKEREKVLAGFRAGSVNVLVATDVAARGLDIPDVEVVVHYELPQDPESFLHRSGRTGRAGRSGIAIAMFTRREIGYFKRILRETETPGVELISPPNPVEVIQAAAKTVMNRLDNVDAEVKTYFAPVAKLVLASRDPLDAVTTALAALSGIKEVPLPRSLLTLVDDMTTLQMMSKEGRINRAGHITAIVSRLTNQEEAGRLGRIRMIPLDKETGMEGAAFDAPHDLARLLTEQDDELSSRGVFLTVPAMLPPEEGLYSDRPRGDRDFGGSGRREFGGRGGGSGGRYGGGGRSNSGGGGWERRGGSRDFGGGSRGGGGGGRDFGGGRGGGRDFGGRGERSDTGGRREWSGGERGGDAGRKDWSGGRRRDSIGGSGGGGGSSGGKRFSDGW